MTIEKDIVMSLLKLTQRGPVRREAVARHAKVTAQLADQELTRLCQCDFLYESKGVIEVSPVERVELALYALRLGADPQRVCDLLSWKEFEGIAAEAFEANGYLVLKNFRFMHASRKWEIDLIALKKPLILCVDCKHWKHGWKRSATARMVQAQIERTEAFSKARGKYRQKARVDRWEVATAIPIVMSLTQGPYKMYKDVPVVPVLQLQDFINELPAHAHLLRRIHQNHLETNGDLSKILSK